VFALKDLPDARRVRSIKSMIVDALEGSTPTKAEMRRRKQTSTNLGVQASIESEPEMRLLDFRVRR
jgi:hypothetical protein